MTLILTVANRTGVYLSSDYQSTRKGRFVTDRAGSKQLQANLRRVQFELAFTGVAEVGPSRARRRTIDVLSEALAALPEDSTIQDVCDALKERCERAIGSRDAKEPPGALTLVVAFAVVGAPFRVAVVSNADWGYRPPRARSTFAISIRKIVRPLSLISGYRDCVPDEERQRLRTLARRSGTPPQEMLDELADINAKSADRSHGYVSRECWSTSQVADGRIRRSMARNIGQTSGAIPLIMGGQDMAEWVRHNFRSADGQEIKLVASSGTVVGAGDLSPDPPSVGPARDVTLSGSSIVWSLRTPNGRTGALLRITQLGCAYRAQRNEVITIPFARVGFDDVGAASTDFGDRKWPWPTLTLALSVDGVAVPEGITYTVGYWQEDARLHVSLPKSSRAIRKVAFLNEDEELVLVSPAKTMDFAWTRPGPTPTGTIEATLWWRLRLDGTRG